MGLRCRERREPVHEPVVGALRLAVKLVDEVLGTLADWFGLQQLGVTEDGGKRIVQLVGDAGDELS